MKLTTRGFTLVELMIVMSIIGILAAVLFPSVTKYLMNGRDTGRTAAVKSIATAVVSYNTTNQGNWPDPSTADDRCFSTGSSLTAELPKIPVDPQWSHMNGVCKGMYGFGTGTVGATQKAAVSAQLEGAKAGNTATGVATYQGKATNDSTVLDQNALANLFADGSGSGYVMVN